MISHPIRSAAVVVLVVLIVVSAWLGKQAYAVWTGVNTMTGVTVPQPTDQPTVFIPPVNSNRRINILLLGSDNDQKVEEAAPLTQSMIVVTIDPQNYSVGLLSIPRDFWVPIPGHGQAKIDLAFKYGFQSGYDGAPRGMKGGVALARSTVENLFHIPIHYYAWVGLEGFSNVIDTFGGVTADVQHPVLDDTYPNDIHSPDPYGMRRLFIPPGWQHMDGRSALEYVRSRHGDEASDFGRSRRQQQILLLLRHKITAMNVITRLPSLVSDLQDSVRTDLTLQQLYQLDELSHHISRASIHRVVLSYPTYCNYAWSPDGQSILQPYWGKILPVVRTMFAPIKRTARPTSTAVESAPRAPTATPGPSATPLSTATSTAQPPTAQKLPGDLLYIDGGNLYELTRGGGRRQLTWSGDAAMPAPAPDGRNVAFVRFTDGLHRFDKYASDVWIMDIGNQKQHVITHDENTVAANNLWAAWPSWSSNGRQLLFSSDRAKLATAPSDSRAIDLAIWEMRADGSAPTQITRPHQGAGGDTDPAWRPNTSQFLYVAWSYPNGSTTPTSQLMLGDIRTRGAVPLTAPGGQVLQPAWDASGHHVVFVRVVGGNSQIVEATVGNGRLRGIRLLAAGQVAQPAFTRDGRTVSFLRVDGDNFRMYLADPRNGSVRRVAGLPGDVDARWRPVWIP